MPMTMDKFQSFCRDMPDIAKGSIIDTLYADLQKAMKTLMVATYAREIAMYASMGVAVVNLCQNPKLDSIQAQAKKLIQKILNPVAAVIDKISMALSLAYMVKQAWDSIPTWEQIAKLIKAEFEKYVNAAIKTAIAELINTVICGNKFQKMAVPQLQGVFSGQLVLITVLGALKTSFEAYEAQ